MGSKGWFGESPAPLEPLELLELLELLEPPGR
jgi:hypothetical protein